MTQRRPPSTPTHIGDLEIIKRLAEQQREIEARPKKGITKAEKRIIDTAEEVRLEPNAVELAFVAECFVLPGLPSGQRSEGQRPERCIDGLAEGLVTE